MSLREERADGVPVTLGQAVKRPGRFLFSRSLWSKAASPGILLASAAIRFYQRYLSPFKGYRCAHGVLHHGPGCSEAVRRIILRRGVFGGWPFIKRRFEACKAAAAALEKKRAANTHRVRAVVLAGALAVSSASALAQADDSCGTRAREYAAEKIREARRELTWKDTCDCVEAACQAAECASGAADCLSGLACVG